MTPLLSTRQSPAGPDVKHGGHAFPPNWLSGEASSQTQLMVVDVLVIGPGCWMAARRVTAKHTDVVDGRCGDGR